MRIGIRGVSKRFGTQVAVDRPSFDIGEGELYTLLGPSGCGKTTLLRLIAGFYTPDEGEVRFDERVMNDVPAHERGIGMVFQNYALWPHMTVSENVAYGLRLRKLPRAEIERRIGEVLQKVGLAGLHGRYPGQLSGGQQQRVALARALVLNPKILLLDEPLSNLDAKIRVQVRAEIRKLQKELAITTVYVTHDQEEALALSDRIAVFNHGRLLQVGPPRELYERPASRFVADFIGINNLIDGVVRSANGLLVVETAVGELRALPDPRFRPGDRCVLSVRPENASIQEAHDNRVGGKIAFAAYLGSVLRYDVDVGNGMLMKADVRDPWHHQPLPPGAAVSVGFAAASTVAIPAE